MPALGLAFAGTGPPTCRCEPVPAERGPPHLFRTQNCEANAVSDVPPSICRASLAGGQGYVVVHQRTARLELNVSRRLPLTISLTPHTV